MTGVGRGYRPPLQSEHRRAMRRRYVQAGSGTRESRKHSRPSSSTAAPAALAPAASGRVRAPTGCTGRANVTTKRQRKRRLIQDAISRE